MPRCFLCNRLGHIARNCLTRPTASAELQSQWQESTEYHEKVAACRSRDSAQIYNARGDLICRTHNRNCCSECNVVPDSTHHCQAACMIAKCQECGLHHPVIADACQFPNKSYRMPVAEGSLEGKPVNVLRDTGCSTIVVRRALVPDDKLTGRKERCILIDGTVRYTPEAKIYVETHYFSGLTTVVCMKNPI